MHNVRVAVKKAILSVDGGGIRGIIPASTLVALEQQLNRPVRECFDFLAGTSTGALITAAAAAGVPAVRILDLYVKRADEIFTPPRPIADAERLVAGNMYDPENMRKVLVGELGAAADWVLNDSPVRLLLTAKGIDTHPWYFVRDNPRNAQSTGRLPLVECAVASACAPTYFKPWTMTIDGSPLVLVDGGAGVTGNPVYQACVEAFYYDDFAPAGTNVISLGTGYFFPPETRTPTGLLGWLNWTVNALLDAPEKQQTELVERHFPGILQRFDWPLPHAIGLADIASIPELVEIGRGIAAKMDWKKILGGPDQPVAKPQ